MVLSHRPTYLCRTGTGHFQGTEAKAPCAGWARDAFLLFVILVFFFGLCDRRVNPLSVGSEENQLWVELARVSVKP